jgi:aryl-alcohol dehydrogenase-like predicted oxidoreductase
VRAGTVAGYLDERGRAVLTELASVARRHGASPATVALAWLAAQPTVSTPIASARTREQLTGLLAMTELRLTDDDLAALGKASATSTG